MDAPSSSGFAAAPIHQAAPNEAMFAADPIYLAAVAVSAGMYGATGSPVMERVYQPQGVPVMEMAPPTTALRPPHAEATMEPPTTATQLLQAVEMAARLSLLTAYPPVDHQPDYFDMASGQQITGCEHGMAGFNESTELPYESYIHSEMPYVDLNECSLPSNATNTLYVEGLPSNCTRREITHLFRPFTGFYEVRMVKGGVDNTHVIALVLFNTPVQAFSAMESLQGYLFDIHDLHSHSLQLHFSPSGQRLGDGPSW